MQWRLDSGAEFGKWSEVRSAEWRIDSEEWRLVESGLELGVSGERRVERGV